MQVSDDPRVGTELAGYRIEALLGLGGRDSVSGSWRGCATVSSSRAPEADEGWCCTRIM